MKKRPSREVEQDRKATLRLRRIQHFEQITRNVSRTSWGTLKTFYR